jgi:hypothetical protein
MPAKQARAPFAKGWKDHAFAVAPAGWTAMESALKAPIPPELRSQVHSCINEYLTSLDRESIAPEMREVVEYAKRVHLLAAKLCEALVTEPMRSDAASLVRADIQAAVDRQTSSLMRPASIEEIAPILLHGAKTALARQLTDAKSLPFVKGDNWEKLVRDVWQLLKAHSLPVGLSNSRPTKFASFFQHLQSALPANARRHTQSVEALGAAMGRTISKTRI